MDRSLKARLIGASVLVLVVVLVAPELLSGRKAATSEAPAATTGNGQTRTYTIELGRPGSAATADAAAPRAQYAPETPPLAAERAPRATQSREPATSPPAARTQAASVPPPEAAAHTREQATTRTTSEATAARDSGAGSAGASDTESTRAPEPAVGSVGDTRPSRGTWSVQVGAFGSSESARKLVEQLEADGFSAYVSSVERNGKRLHRVRVGPEAARATADALAGRLRSRGLPVSLVAND